MIWPIHEHENLRKEERTAQQQTSSGFDGGGGGGFSGKKIIKKIKKKEGEKVAFGCVADSRLKNDVGSKKFSQGN